MTTVNLDDFLKIDLRVGTIVDARIPEGSNKLLRLSVDLGEDLGTRVIFAGLKGSYDADDLVNKQIVVVANLAPKEFFGEKGEGMLLAADEKDGPILLAPLRNVPNGTRIR